MYLASLGHSLCYRYRHLGDLDALREAITYFQKAVHITNEDHPRRAQYLSRLGTTYQLRFDGLGAVKDYVAAVAAFQAAAQQKTAYPHDALDAA